MQRTLLFAAAALAATTLAACGGNDQGGVASQDNDAVNVAQDVAGAATGIGTAAVGAVSTDAYIRDAAMGDMYEIQAAQIALERSKNPEVRNAAQMIIADHTKSSNELKQLISSGQVQGTLPTMLDERRQGMLDHLRQAPDDAFDNRYLDQQKMAHQEAIALHKGYADHGDNPQLRSVAMGGLPMIERHLKMLGRIDTRH